MIDFCPEWPAFSTAIVVDGAVTTLDVFALSALVPSIVELMLVELNMTSCCVNGCLPSPNVLVEHIMLLLLILLSCSLLFFKTDVTTQPSDVVNGVLEWKRSTNDACVKTIMLVSFLLIVSWLNKSEDEHFAEVVIMSTI